MTDPDAIRRIRREVEQDASLRMFADEEDEWDWVLDEFERRVITLLEREPEPRHLLLRASEQQWLSEGDTLRVDWRDGDAVVSLDGAVLDFEVAGDVG